MEHNTSYLFTVICRHLKHEVKEALQSWFKQQEIQVLDTKTSSTLYDVLSFKEHWADYWNGETEISPRAERGLIHVIGLKHQ